MLIGPQKELHTAVILRSLRARAETSQNESNLPKSLAIVHRLRRKPRSQTKISTHPGDTCTSVPMPPHPEELRNKPTSENPSRSAPSSTHFACVARAEVLAWQRPPSPPRSRARRAWRSSASQKLLRTYDAVRSARMSLLLEATTC